MPKSDPIFDAASMIGCVVRASAIMAKAASNAGSALGIRQAPALPATSIHRLFRVLLCRSPLVRL